MGEIPLPTTTCEKRHAAESEQGERGRFGHGSGNGNCGVALPMVTTPVPGFRPLVPVKVKLPFQFIAWLARTMPATVLSPLRP